MDLFEYIQNLIKEKGNIVLCVDGFSGAGKEIFAKKLSALGESRIIYMSDFALPKEMESENRYKKLGGNIYWEKFKEEVLPNIRGNLAYTTSDGTSRLYKPMPLTIVAGTYSMHKEFGDYWDMSFFLSIDPKEQIKKLAKRDISKLQDYKEKWIPMENAYFEKWKIKDKADVLLG